MFFNDEKKDLIKESLIILVFFWLISFLVIFYRYQDAVTKEKHFQVELMKSQSELLSKTMAGEVKTALSDLVWYASEKKNKEGVISDVSSLNDEVLQQLLQYKDRYKRLVIYDANNQVIKEVKNIARPILLDSTEDTFSNFREVNDYLLSSKERVAISEYAPDGDVTLAIRTSDQKKVVWLELELENYNTLKLSIEREFGFFVGVTFKTGELWQTMGNPDVLPCIDGSNDLDVQQDSKESSYIMENSRLAAWSCLSSHSNIPFGIDDVIWLNEADELEGSLIVMTTLSGQDYRNIEDVQFEQMKDISYVILTVQFVASIILGYVYHKYQLSQDALKLQATRDGLTGCLNRWAGFEILKKLMSMSDRNRTELTVAFIDIDKLKNVNDVYGHDDGDLLIRMVADSIQSYTRDSDSLIRIGGDEFILILANCDNEKANEILLRSSALLDSFNQSERYAWQASFSYGLATYTPNSKQLPHDLIQEADKAMYIQKSSKKEVIS